MKDDDIAIEVGQTTKDRFAYCVDAEYDFARAKFPKCDDMIAALMEEVGELANALLENKYGNSSREKVFAEAVQVASTAMRIALEGDTNFPYKYDYECYRKFDVNKIDKLLKARNSEDK